MNASRFLAAAALASLLALALAATAAVAAPAREAGSFGRGCEVEAEGSLSGKRSFELEVEAERSAPEGKLRFRDAPAGIDFRATAITKLVVTGRIASIQGRGTTKIASGLPFNASLDAAANTFAIRLGNGYAAQGSFTGVDELDGFCPFDGRTTVLLDPARATSGTLGRAGGSLTAGGVTLAIPAGALSEETSITITPLTDLADSPLAGSLIGGAKLEPDGLRFLKPALLRMPLPAGVSPASVLGFGSAGDGSELHLEPREIAAGTITLELWHFSTAGGSSGGSSAAAAVQSRTPSAAEQQARQRIAVAQPACEAELTQGIQGGPACTNLQQESIRALFDWYTNAVRPGLDQADTALSFDAEKALAEWLAWAAEVARVFQAVQGSSQCGTLQNECDQAHALATTAVAAHTQRRLDNCTGTSLAAQLRDVARMADFAGAGAIDLTTASPPLPDATSGALLRACAHLEIAITDFPAVAAVDFANTLRGGVTVDVYSGPDRTDVPFTLLVGGALVLTAADGSFQTTLTPTTGLPLNVTLEAEATNPLLQNTAFTDVETLNRPTRERLQLLAQSSTTVAAGGMISLRVRVAGDGMAGMTVVFGGPISSASPSPVITNSQGEANAVVTILSNATNTSDFITAVLPDSTTDSIAITIGVAVTVGLSPVSATVNVGGAVNFTATVTGSFLGVTWSATGGTIVNTGSVSANTARYEAGQTPGTHTVTATSIADPTKAASTTVTVTATTAGQIVVHRRGSSVSAQCGVEHPSVGDCQGPDSFTSALLGPFSFTAVEAVTGTIEDPASFPSFQEQASSSASQSSDVQVGGPFPLLLDFSGVVAASATAQAGVNVHPEGGGVARAGAQASGNSRFDVEFEVVGSAMPFIVFGALSVSGSGCVNVVLDRQSASGREFEVDFCAGDPPQSLNESGSLAPGRYRFTTAIGAGAIRVSDADADGVIRSDGIAAGNADATVDLIVG